MIAAWLTASFLFETRGVSRALHIREANVISRRWAAFVR